MTFINSDEYLKLKDVNPQNNNYLKQEANFSGAIIYHNLDGTYNTSKRFSKNENLLNKLSSSKNEIPGKISQAIPPGCYEEEVWELFGEGCSEVPGGIHCNYIYSELLGTYLICPDGNNTNPGGGGGSTNPASDIRNQTTEPCIFKTVKEVLAASKNIEGAMADIVKNFDASKNVQINVLDGITDDNAPGQVKFPTFEGNIFKANIILQTSYFKGPEAASKESLAAVLIHELIHAYIKSVNPDLLKSQHHNEIANNYIAPMTEYLHNKFGIKEEDAFALAWSGVPESEIFGPANNETTFSFKVNNITKFSISKSEIYARAGAYNGNTSYQNEGIKGTQICN